MSHSFFTNMWVSAQNALEDLLLDELPHSEQQPQKDLPHVFQGLATFYLKYLQIFRSLELIHDQVAHPQKRRVVRSMLDGVMGRLLELKNEMVELEHSEFHYFDDILQDLKLMPEDLEIPIPRYFLREKIQVLRDREKMLSQILCQNGQKEPNMPSHMSLDEAVHVLQVCERARRGRQRAMFMKLIRRMKFGSLARIPHVPEGLISDQAATRIQKVWRGYSRRKNTEKERLEEMIFLGMVAPEPAGPSAAQLKARQVEARRRLVQEQREEEYQSALCSVKESLRAAEETDARETLQGLIRQWFIECRDTTGKFPDFPDAEDGGSACIFSQKTPEQVATERAAKEQEKKKKKKDLAKKDQLGGKEKADKTGKPKGKKRKEIKEEEVEKGWKMAASSFLPTVMEGQKIYRDVWQRYDESHSFSQRFDAQLMQKEKRLEMEEEVRVQVDELMRQELKNLKLTVDRDKGTKQKKAKKSTIKKKKNKASKKKKKKKERDLTADRTIESLYEEMILQGFLIRPKTVMLSDYIGEYSYLGTTLRQEGIEPMPSLSDVRQLVALFGVLPLGCQLLHEKAPPIKTLLLAGPSGVGKKMLVHAICTETGANLFNLSPGNLVGKYPGRSGLQYLLHVVLKVARQLQPSVIWIGDAEKTFYKKVPKTEKEMEPKRLKKELCKVVKSVRPGDRVLVVGTTRRPFDADLKPFCKVFKKIILIPRPDYASRLVLWRELLLAGGSVHTPGMDLSSLAKVTDGYTQGHIAQAIGKVLTPHRLAPGHRPLTTAEFILPLARLNPVFREEEEAFKVWYSKTPLGKKKARAAKTFMEEAATGRKKGKDKKIKVVKRKRTKK